MRLVTGISREGEVGVAWAVKASPRVKAAVAAANIMRSRLEGFMALGFGM